MLLYIICALILLIGRQKERPACKNWVMRCWCGYLSWARFRLFAYGSANATASLRPYNPLCHLNSGCFYLSGIRLPRVVLEKNPLCVVVVVVVVHHLIQLASLLHPISKVKWDDTFHTNAKTEVIFLRPWLRSRPNPWDQDFGLETGLVSLMTLTSLNDLQDYFASCEIILNAGARFTKYLTTILRSSHDNAKLTIDLQWTSILLNILEITQAFS